LPILLAVMPMTPQEFRRALARLGLSQVQVAKQLGVAPRTVRYWLAKDKATRTPIPEPVAILVRLWLKARRPK